MKIVNFCRYCLESRLVKSILRVKQRMVDKKLGREMIGKDSVGNKYYQYYSWHGLPTRREVRFNQKEHYKLQDLVYYDWLNKWRELPPSEQQKRQYYKALQQRKRKALEWKQKEQMEMLQFRRRKDKIRKELGLSEMDAVKQLQLQSKQRQT